MLFNLYGMVIGKPVFWIDISDKVIVSIIDINNRTGITLDYWNLLSVARINNNTLREVRILDFYFNYQDYYESTVVLPLDISTSQVFFLHNYWKNCVNSYKKVRKMGIRSKVICRNEWNWEYSGEFAWNNDK